MEPLLLDRLRAFHRHLVALHAAGVPLDLEAGADDLGAMLRQIESRLELRVDLGQTVEAALKDDGELPASYRCTALMLLASNNDADALDVITRHAGTAPGFRRSLFQSLAPTAIVGALVYVGLIGLCLYTAPRFEALYLQIQETPSFSLRVLGWLREWLPVWAPIAPVVFVLAGWAGHRADWPRLLRWAPAMRAFRQAQSRAAFADLLSRLSESNLPLEVASPVAERYSDALSGKQGAATFLKAIGTPSTTDDRSASTTPTRHRELPPLLRWALADRTAPNLLANNLRFAANAYRNAARHRARYWNAAGTMFIGTLISGVVLLAYGWTVFSPFASLMKDISQATSYVEIQAPSGTLAKGEKP